MRESGPSIDAPATRMSCFISLHDMCSFDLEQKITKGTKKCPNHFPQVVTQSPVILFVAFVHLCSWS
jgi:hypothetical protein